MNNAPKNQKIALNNHALDILSAPIVINRPFVYHCASTWSWRPEIFPNFDLWLVFSGSGTLWHPGGEFPIASGFCALFQPGDHVQGSHDPDDPLEVFACRFIPARSDPPFPRLTKHLLYGQIDRVPEMRRSSEIASRLFDRDDLGKRYAAAIVGQLLWQTVYHLKHPDDASALNPRLATLGLEISARPGLEWSIAGMAKQCGLSIPHFNRTFRAVHGCAPMRFVIRQRLLRAITLLRESDMSIQQIADSLGYRDTFFFHRQFRAMTGATPRAVRLGETTLLDIQMADP